MNKPNCFILNCTGLSILDQLQIEEAIFRSSCDNWFIYNQSSSPAVVVGAFADLNQVIDFKILEENPMPVIRRFTGGGTVVVDENTLFQSFIFNKQTLLIDPFPESIMKWHAQILAESHPFLGINLTETDLTLKDLKFAGNAQSISRNRWIHHTSFLWDYKISNMQILKYPPKTPNYRNNRSHESFLTKLSLHLENKNVWTMPIIDHLNREFNILPASKKTVEEMLKTDHRKMTQLIVS